MTRKGPPRPNPIALGKPLYSNPAAGVYPEPPARDIDEAVEKLKQASLTPVEIRSSLKTLQIVVWKRRQDNRWVDLEPSNPIVSQLEDAWRVSLTIATTQTSTVCRLCGLETKQHPFCSKTGERHPEIRFADYAQYRRTYVLPARVKEMLATKYLQDLVDMMKTHEGSTDVLVFVMMVITEITSPKLAIDNNKKELLDAGALPLLLQAMERFEPVEVICQDACAVLRNLLTHIPTNTEFERIEGTRLLIRCIDKYPMNQELVHRACGCILILASRGAESRRRLFTLDVVKTLMTVLETPHGREHIVRRLITTTFTKLIKSIDKSEFCAAMEAVKGFSVFNALFNSTRDDDHAGLAEVLAMRGDLPRGTFVDPTVLVIDAKGDLHEESFVQMLKSNEQRDYKDDPATPKVGPTPTVSWPASTAASPLFPSPPSFGADDFDEADEGPLATVASKVQRARTPGAAKVAQSTLPDVAMADDDLAFTSHNITTPGTMAQILSDTKHLKAYLGNMGMTPKHQAAHRAAKDCMEFLDANFTEQGLFRRTTEFSTKLYGYLSKLVDEVVEILQKQPKLVDMKAPVYVFGDIHGNFGDLQYFLQRLTVFKNFSYTPHSFLFVGDYVDRGRWGCEVMAYLLASKVLAPNDFILLRGNHEDVVVNGDAEMYGEGSFKKQCINAFQDAVGVKGALDIFDKINGAFKHFPIAAVIENKIFAAHGGIPRFGGGDDIRMETLRDPNFKAFDDFILPYHIDMNNTETRQHVYAHDCIWSDPSTVGERLDEFGFGHSSRGGQVVSYSQQAIHSFLDSSGMEFIIRGHEEKADGLNISKQARVLTVFSTSDYCRKGNRAGVALVRSLQNGDLMCRMIHRAKPSDQLSAY